MEIESEKPLPKTAPELLRGVICVQWVRCGKPTCRCARGELHGPYHYRFYWEGGRRRKTYIRKAELERAQRACEANREVRAFVREHQANRRLMMRHFRELLSEIREQEQHSARARKGLES